MCKSYEFEKLAQAHQRDLARSLPHAALVREAQRGHPYHAHTMLQLTLGDLVAEAGQAVKRRTASRSYQERLYSRHEEILY